MTPTHLRAALAAAVLSAGLIFPSGLPLSAQSSARYDGPALQGQDQGQDDQTQGDQTPHAQNPIRVNVGLVNLFVTVRDKHNAIIPDLTQNDFKVYEDGQEQKVAFFSKEVDLPITLGLLLDTSGSESDMLPAEQDAASRFIHTVLRKNDEAMVMSFDLDSDLLADFTEDRSVLDRAIHKATINAASGGGGTATTIPQNGPMGTVFYDAVYLACHDELRDQAGRKAIVAITDAQDEGSKLKVDDAIEAAQRSDTVIHIILVVDPRYGGGFFGGIGYSGGSVAQRMAEQTGGRVIEVRSEKNLEKAFDEISEELRSQYVIGYYPTNTKRDGTFRKIKVETTTSDTKILTRRGYYAPTD
jgi:VWFA-related protein